MRYVKWFVLLLIIGVYAGFLAYSLPSRDIVRIVSTDVVRVTQERKDPEGNKVLVTRDQMRINSITPEGRERVYRNEDTGWSFPWYFKFDSADLAARAENFKSTEENPRWVIVTHYGWRVTYFSWFPNAVSIRPAEGPDQELIPWFNIVFVTLLTFGLIAIWRIVQMFIRRNFDPVLDELDERRGVFSRFWRSLFG